MRARDAVWAAITLVILAAWVFLAARFSQTAWDFTMFYVAAHTPLHSLHDQAVFQSVARSALAGTGVKYASPYVRPAVFALALQWMRGLSYWTAFRIWAAFQFVFYCATLGLLARRFHAPVVGFYPWAVFFPAFFGIVTGQDAVGVTLVLCAALAFLCDGRQTIAGALFSLTLYKFNLFLLLPIYLAIQKQYRALAAYAACGAVFAAASALLEPPSKYLALLPNIQLYTIGFSPKTMLGLRGLSNTLGAGAAYPFAAVLLAAYMLIRSRRMELARGLGLIVIACLLCAYHGTWYDGAALALPFALALAKGAPGLKLAAACLMTLPLWNAIPALVSALLLGFAFYYAADSSWIASKSEA